MKSRILFHRATKKIVYAQPQPNGSAPVPSHATILRNCRIKEGRDDQFDSIVVEGEWTTFEAQKSLRI